VKIEYACTGCSDSSADKAAPRPVDSVMEIPSALAHHLLRVTGELPRLDLCSKPITVSRYFIPTARDNEKNRVTRATRRGGRGDSAERYFKRFIARPKYFK